MICSRCASSFIHQLNSHNLVAFNRLEMDGTSKAAENCRFLPILEGQLLTMDKYIDGSFENHKMLATFKPTTQSNGLSSVSTLFEETQMSSCACSNKSFLTSHGFSFL